MPTLPTTFAALDFETANHDVSSVCAIGAVRVERGVVVERRAQLVRPPTDWFQFTRVHGITARDVARAPDFATAWRAIAPLLEGAELIAAHNASFERRVIEACVDAFGVRRPSAPLECTMRLARQRWGLRPTKLSDCARFLGIELRHHDPLSDAEASARIVLAARRQIRGRRTSTGRAR